MKPTMSMTTTLPTPEEAMLPTTEPLPAAADPITALSIAAPAPPAKTPEMVLPTGPKLRFLKIAPAMLPPTATRGP
jgi:hypothetical protein